MSEKTFRVSFPNTKSRFLLLSLFWSIIATVAITIFLILVVWFIQQPSSSFSLLLFLPFTYLFFAFFIAIIPKSANLEILPDMLVISAKDKTYHYQKIDLIELQFRSYWARRAMKNEIICSVKTTQNSGINLSIKLNDLESLLHLFEEMGYIVKNNLRKKPKIMMRNEKIVFGVFVVWLFGILLMFLIFFSYKPMFAIASKARIGSWYVLSPSRQQTLCELYDKYFFKSSVIRGNRISRIGTDFGYHQWYIPQFSIQENACIYPAIGAMFNNDGQVYVKVIDMLNEKQLFSWEGSFEDVPRTMYEVFQQYPILGQ